tara:strand:+ start:1573 stop:2361 length:789 start_codon:yes stop_codon:yes gene_type:complete
MIKAKKSLGQNFLIDQNIIDKIVNIIDVRDKNILEVGPGTGNLTEKILKKKPNNFLVVEKDYNLVNLLQEKFNGKIKIINDDILKIEENSLSKEILTVYGNLPYNISTEILIKWILNMKEKKIWFNYLILMFQKEVADRIISKFDTKDYGRLTVLANWRLKIKKICDIYPSCFSPKPKVESTLLIFEPKRNFVKFINPKNLEKITRVFFMHRRKMIKKPFLNLFNNDINYASKMKLDLRLRPQNLDLDTYLNLTKEYESLTS